MNRVFTSYPVQDAEKIKTQMLNWANQFNIFCFLDSHHYHQKHSSIECLMGVGSVDFISCSAGSALPQLGEFYKKHQDWLFGHLAYDLKNETEQQTSSNPDFILFPDLYFFVPEIVIQLTDTQLKIGLPADNTRNIYREISDCSSEAPVKKVNADIHHRFSRDEYIDVIRKLKEHILKGDCYEINFCQEFYTEQIDIDPLAAFFALSAASPNPFAAYYRVNDKYLLCASPERYIQKTGNTIYSQPIKGTSKRDLSSKEQDRQNKIHLEESAKDRSENVMVVDLVRNDLSKVCKQGSVKVEELFGVYSYPQVHQMISTIRGELNDNVQLVDILQATFPMGSMTGAPKRSVVELIERYERTRRGIFSGSVGYVKPAGDFDFNVVIRSILYNATSKYLSFQTGSGITYYSDPESEYEECQLKATAIKKVLTGEANTLI